jgi:SMI1/KNR4 family protein SUKH-1
VDWAQVRDRVIAVEEAEDRAAGVQAAYPVFESALSASEIAEVEAQYGVALPDEYRSFLAEVGAGGPLVDADGNLHTFSTWYTGWLERREAEAGLRDDAPDPPVQISRLSRAPQGDCGVSGRRAT